MAEKEESSLKFRWSKVEGGVYRSADLVTPNQRSLHTLTLVGSKIFVLGGWAPNIHWSHLNIHWLDYTNLQWHMIEASGDPHRNVYYHAAVLVHDQIYLFGGKMKTACRESFTKFDTVTGELTVVQAPGALPRFGHCAEFMELFDAVVLLFGQTTKGQIKASRSVESYNVKTGVWKRLKPKGKCPRLAAFGINRSSCSHSTSIFCFTGHVGRSHAGQELSLLKFSSKLEKCTWETPLIRGAVPKLHGSSSLSFVNNHLVLFGGAVSTNALAADSDQVYVYDMANQVCLDEQDLVIEGVKAGSRRNHENVLVNGKILVFGGFGKRLNPFLELDVSSLLLRHGR